MKNRLFLLMPSLAAVCLLTACGGGDSEPTPSNEKSLITVTSASVASLKGVYGSTAVTLSDVEKVFNLSSTTCTFSFGNLVKLDDRSIPMSGKISYLEGAAILSRLEISVNGIVYASGAVDNSTVDRGNNEIRFGEKQLAATSGDNTTLVVLGLLPMRGNRPSGC